jgi:hypothetical protein
MTICCGHKDHGLLLHDQKEKSMVIRAEDWGQQLKITLKTIPILTLKIVPL